MLVARLNAKIFGLAIKSVKQIEGNSGDTHIVPKISFFQASLDAALPFGAVRKNVNFFFERAIVSFT